MAAPIIIKVSHVDFSFGSLAFSFPAFAMALIKFIIIIRKGSDVDFALGALAFAFPAFAMDLIKFIIKRRNVVPAFATALEENLSFVEFAFVAKLAFAVFFQQISVGRIESLTWRQNMNAAFAFEKLCHRLCRL